MFAWVQTIPLAETLPHSTGPYVVMMMAGFALAIFGHLSRSRWLVAIGIIVIFLAVAALPIVLNLFGEAPESPGPLPPP